MSEKKPISEIKALFNGADIKTLPELITEFSSDERAGVQTLINSSNKKIEKYNNELKRLEIMREFEKKYEGDFDFICGLDEVGRGPLAGPVVTGAVILPKGLKIMYVNDSKQLSEKMREELSLEIMDKAIAYSFGVVDNEVIDDINILQATFKAFRMAINDLSVKPDILLNDAVKIPEVDIRQVPIIKGDAKSISIASASIIAKVKRDKMMVEYDKIYPEYGFASNKGYGSQAHIEALKKYGPTPIHRKSFIGNFI